MGKIVIASGLGAANAGGTISARLPDGRVVQAKAGAAISTSKVIVMEDDSGQFHAFPEAPSTGAVTTRQIYRSKRKPAPAPIFDDYFFKVLQSSSIEGFDADIDLDLTGYSLVGIINTGAGYIAILSQSNVYVVCTPSGTYTIDISIIGLPFTLLAWRGGAYVGVIKVPDASQLTSTINTALQIYNIPFCVILPYAEMPCVRFLFSMTGVPAQSWSFGTSIVYGPPFAVNPVGGDRYYGESPDPHSNYSGTATREGTYANGSGSYSTSRTITHDIDFTPFSGGNFNTTIDAQHSIDRQNRINYIVNKIDGTQLSFESYTLFNDSTWSLTGTGSGSFALYNGDDPDKTFTLSASDSYVGSGAFNYGVDQIVYVNPESLLELRYKKVLNGTWSKTVNATAGNAQVIYSIPTEHDVYIDNTVSVTESFSYSEIFDYYDVYMESHDAFIYLHSFYSLEYSYDDVLDFSINREIGAINTAQYTVFTSSRYPVLPGHPRNIVVTMLSGESLNGIDLLSQVFIAPAPASEGVVQIGLDAYPFSITSDACYAWVGSWGLPINDPLATEISLYDLDLTQRLNGIASVSCIDNEWTNHHTVTQQIPYALLGQDVLVIYSNGSEYWECEGVITSTDEQVDSYVESAPNGTEFPYFFTGVTEWSCDSITVALDTATKTSVGFFAYSSVLTFMPDHYCVVINKNDFNKLIIDIISTPQRRRAMNLYKVGETIELAISRKPSNTEEKSEWRADIYRFNTATLKWERRPNAVSPLSQLSAVSSHISYHPDPSG